MKSESSFSVKFVNTVIEELALIRGELISQRKLLIEIASRLSHEPRRKIKDRSYDRRLEGLDIARKVKRSLGLVEKSGQP